MSNELMVPPKLPLLLLLFLLLLHVLTYFKLIFCSPPPTPCNSTARTLEQHRAAALGSSVLAGINIHSV